MQPSFLLETTSLPAADVPQKPLGDLRLHRRQQPTSTLTFKTNSSANHLRLYLIRFSGKGPILLLMVQELEDQSDLPLFYVRWLMTLILT